MKIAIDATAAFGPRSGLRRYVESLVDRIARLDTENEYLLYGFFWKKFPSEADLTRLPRKQNFRFLFKKIPQRLLLPAEYYLRLNMQERWLRDEGVGLFHGTGNILPEFKEIPSVLTHHHMGADLGSTSWWDDFYFNKLARRGAETASKIIAVSQYSKDRLVGKYNIPEEKVAVVHNGIEDRFLSGAGSVSLPAGLEARSPYILFVSGIFERKNLLTLVRAFKRLCASKDFKHNLVLVGHQPPYFKVIADECSRLGITGRVIFLQEARDEELTAIYRRAEVFVYPSLLEGFGLPVLEAMACGVPVIAARSSSLPETGGDAAAYFEPLDEEGLAGEISALLRDASKRNGLVRRGLARAGEFTWERTARQTLEVYKSLLK